MSWMIGDKLQHQPKKHKSCTSRQIVYQNQNTNIKKLKQL